MKLYLDSAEPAQWRASPGWPALAGVTTNPSLVHQAGRAVNTETYLALIAQAGQCGLPELMLQLPRASQAEAQACLAQWLPAAVAAQVQLTVKLPCHPEWADALRCVQAHGVPVLLTGLSNALQLLWAVDQGARWVAPYLGRLQDDGRDVWALVDACVALQPQGTQLLAASVRSPEVLARLVAAGAAAATVRPDVLQAWTHDPLTDAAIAQFDADIAASEVV
jgi:transaldolase